jgi:hypothetical protein
MRKVDQADFPRVAPPLVESGGGIFSSPER